MKLTKQLVSTVALPPGKTDGFFWDSELPGFGVRIQGDRRSFVYQYRLGGKSKRITLGPATKDTLDGARKIAGDHALKVKAGDDPALAKVVAIQEASKTFGSILDDFVGAFRSKWSEQYTADVERTLRVRCVALHKLPVAKVERSDIAARLTEIAKYGEKAANRARAHMGKFFDWTISQGYRETNPVEHTHKFEEQSCERVLTHAELKRIWEACRDDDFGAIVRLLMLTGCRLREIGHLRYSEIKGDLLELDGERIKNGRAHVVPLSDLASEIVQRFAAAQPEGRKCVFGRDGNGFEGYDKAKTALDERAGGFAQSWTLHDLRRTMATLMAEELQIPPHIVEALLNHVSGHKAGVAGVYNRASYIREKRAALDAWANHLAEIVAGRKRANLKAVA